MISKTPIESYSRAQFGRAVHRSLLVIATALAFMQVGNAEIVVFSDDLENGSSNWTTYPGSSPLEYVSTLTDPNANRTPGGSYGLKLSDPNDRVYHDVDLTAYPDASVRFSLWFYDTMDRRPFSFSPFDIRTASASQVLGLGVHYSSNFYRARLLRTADGSAAPNWVNTTIPRSVGWHHFEIIQYRGDQAGTVEYYVDGILGYQTTNAFDATLNRIVLGLGWPGNLYQEGYVDDISYSVIVPEPHSLLLATLFALSLGIGRHR